MPKDTTRREWDPQGTASQKGFAYNQELGSWWCGRAADAAHARAYRKIAAYMRASYAQSPRMIVDYACGPGHLLARLSKLFPHSTLVGVDGSSFLLEIAQQRLSRLSIGKLRRVRLIETPLPNLNILPSRAGLVVFSFPNMVPFYSEDDFRRSEGLLEPDDLAVARTLADVAEPEEEQASDPEAVRFSLIQARLVSLNLRRLLVKGGICVRVEYGRARREELSHLDLMRISFEEGSLDEPVEGRYSRLWFRVAASAYFRSRVIEDVYEQTRNREDLEGGYLITVLRAL